MINKIKKYLKIGTAVIILAVIAFYGLAKYQDWKFNKELKELTEKTNRPYLEDTYGGKTPKETLELFIVAVEKGDFDLASKYFVISKQEEWKNALVNAKNANKLDVLMSEVFITSEEIKKEKPIWEEREIYIFINSNSVSFDFIKYPQGIWKIKEI